MGLTKNYLRVVQEASFGLVAASQKGSFIRFLQMQDTKDRFVAVPANENIFIWDLKTKQIHNVIHSDEKVPTDTTSFECYHGGHPRLNLIAVGYANGSTKVFEYETGYMKASFVGHRTAVTALAFDRTGSRLATGGQDSKVAIWDLVGERGLFTLRGHKNSISKVAFLETENKDVLITSSLDTVSAIKFWDIKAQHSFHTIPGSSSGVWSFVLLKGDTRLVTGSSSSELKVYSIMEDDSDFGLCIQHMGNILRTATSNRVQDLVVDPEERLMICQSTDKHIEYFGLRTEEEMKTYAKKKAKKAKRKKSGAEDQSASQVDQKDSIPFQPKLIEIEFNEKLGSQKLNEKIQSLAIESGKNGSYNLAIVCTSNKIEKYILAFESEEILTIQSCIEAPSHRKDVIDISISADNTLILSTSSESLKVWRLDSRVCVSTISVDGATCCSFLEVQHIISTSFKNRFALVGTKSGSLQLIDIANASVIETIEVSEKKINAIFTLPDHTGIVCGGEDGVLRFYSYTWKEETVLSLEESNKLAFQEGITCVSVTANSRLIAVALLDSTVRVHFLDSNKYFLTLYGHKFPISAMDISDDSTLLITGSPDKNIKIWGLDFGDCHKSIFAHEDTITSLKFVPKTHHVFSGGRDGQIKEWDCDKFLKIQTLRKHIAEVWCLSVSPNGRFLVSGSHDKSLKLYRRTEEILVPSEEEETERELLDERDVFEKQENIIMGDTNTEIGFAAKMTIETVKSTDRLIEAMDVFGEEQEKERDYIEKCKLAESRGEPEPAEPERNPLLLTAMTTDYNKFMLEVLRRIRSSELEEILLTLPFEYVRRLLIINVIFLERRWDIELMVRCATFLLKVNFGQIAASPALSPVVHKLKTVIMDRSTSLRECTGFNLLALDHLSHKRKSQAATL